MSHETPDGEATRDHFEKADQTAGELLELDRCDSKWSDASNADFTREERRRVADLLWIDALLTHLHRPETELRDRRLQRAILTIAASNIVEPSIMKAGGMSEETANGGEPITTRRSWIRRFSTIAIVLLCFVVIRNVTDRQPSASAALAAVERSLAEAEDAPGREYRVTAALGGPNGEHEVVSTLFVHGRRFALRQPALLLRGEIWVGCDGEETWFVPPVGPVLVSRDERLLHRLSADDRLSTPVLHVASVLARMKDLYDLEFLPRVSLPAESDPDKVVRVDLIRGTLREPAAPWPQTIELAAEVRTGIAYRLDLDWNRTAGERGPKHVRIDLQKSLELPADFFEHSGHHAPARRVLGDSSRGEVPAEGAGDKTHVTPSEPN